MALEPPTDRELDAMRAIFTMREKRGFPPTLVELCTELGCSEASKYWAHTLVKSLRRKGLATAIDRRPGTLDLTQRGRDFLLGRAA